MNEKIQRVGQEQAAKAIEAVEHRSVRYFHGSAEDWKVMGEAVDKIREENPEAVDIRMYPVMNPQGQPSALVQAYNGDGKPVGDALIGPLPPCPPCCPKCPGDPD